MIKLFASFFVFQLCIVQYSNLRAQSYQTEFHRLINEKEFDANIDHEASIFEKKPDFSKVIFRTGISAGSYFLSSNQKYINLLNLSQGIFSVDLEIYPFANFGLGVSSSTSNLHDPETEHLIEGKVNTSDIYAIIRSNPIGNYKGYIGIYFGGGIADQILIEADPEFYDVEISGKGTSRTFGIVLQSFGKSRLGWTFDASYREVNIPAYYFTKSGEEFLTFSENPQLMNSELNGFSFKLGIALLLY